MTKSEALEFFGSASELAWICRCSNAAVSMWPERLPTHRQYQIAEASGWRMQVDEHVRPRSARAAGQAA